MNFAIFVLDIFTTNSKSIEVTESLKGYEHFSSSHFEYVWNSSFIWREHIWCEVQLQNVQGKLAVCVYSLMYLLWNTSKMKYMDEDIMEDKGSGVVASHLFLY